VDSSPSSTQRFAIPAEVPSTPRSETVIYSLRDLTILADHSLPLQARLFAPESSDARSSHLIAPSRSPTDMASSPPIEPLNTRSPDDCRCHAQSPCALCSVYIDHHRGICPDLHRQPQKLALTFRVQRFSSPICSRHRGFLIDGRLDDTPIFCLARKPSSHALKNPTTVSALRIGGLAAPAQEGDSVGGSPFPTALGSVCDVALTPLAKLQCSRHLPRV